MGSESRINELPERIREQLEESDRVKAWEEYRMHGSFNPKRKNVRTGLFLENPDSILLDYREDNPERDSETALREIEGLLEDGAHVKHINNNGEEFCIKLEVPNYCSNIGNAVTLAYEGPFEDQKQEPEQEETVYEPEDLDYSFEEMVDIAEDIKELEGKEVFDGYSHKLPLKIWDPEGYKLTHTNPKEDWMTRSGHKASLELEWLKDNRQISVKSTEYSEEDNNYKLEINVALDGKNMNIVYETPNDNQPDEKGVLETITGYFPLLESSLESEENLREENY